MGVGDPQHTFTDEVLRINDRYLKEFVSALHLCPFARFDEARLHRLVFPDQKPDVALCRNAIRAAEPQSFEVALLIFPRCTMDVNEFEQFVAALRGETRVFAMAAFHPQGKFSSETAAQLVPLFRRAPDPTIQLVRFSLLDQVKAQRPTGKILFDGSAAGQAALAALGRPSISDEVAENNFSTTKRLGLAQIEAILAEIIQDRARSYARYTP